MTDQLKDLDSKFRLITIASKRCEQLHHGARPKFDTVSKKWSWIALEEVKRGLVDFEIIDMPIEADAEDYEGDVFLEGDMGMPIDDSLPPVVIPGDDSEEVSPKSKKTSKPLPAADSGDSADDMSADESVEDVATDDSEGELLDSEDDD